MARESSSGVRIEGSDWDLVPDFSERIPTQPRIRIPADAYRASNEAVRARIRIGPDDADLTKQGDGAPIGQRIVVAGRVVDAEGKPLPDTLIEIWQCNASGAYRDFADPGESPLDPNFIGKGRCVTNADGEYRLITIKPAAYPGPEGSGVPYRPAHLHVSIIGPDIKQRLMTQCYFEGDPLFETDFVTTAVPDPEERPGLLAAYAPELTVHGGLEKVLGYQWDVVLGSGGTPMEW